MTEKENLKVNFFKPLSQHARANKKLILTLAIIWAIGVFGFQILLIVLNEPTPEKNYTTFESIWPNVVENSEVAIETKQEFSKVILAVLGKNIAVKDHHKAILKKTLSWTVYSMLSDSVKSILTTEPDENAINLASQTIGLTSTGFDIIKKALLPSSIVKVDSEQLSSECKEAIPGIMKLYLVHNQNIFTNFKFIGFPFHYWYTAQFLLIMFVILCLIYAVTIDRMNKKYDFVEET